MLTLHPPGVIKAIVQRSLLKQWERLGASGTCAPVTALAADPDIRQLLTDCVVYEAPPSPDGPFTLFYQGPNTVHFYGGELRAASPLGEHVAPRFRDQVVKSYRAVVATSRPWFSIRTIRDAVNRTVAVETLRLPFSAAPARRVTHVLTHFHAISLEGHFTAEGLHRDHGSCRYEVEALIASP